MNLHAKKVAAGFHFKNLHRSFTFSYNRWKLQSEIWCNVDVIRCVITTT